MRDRMALEILSYGFMQNAFMGGFMIAIMCALTGTFLVLRRLSLLSDGLGHVAFGGIALGLLLKIDPIISALALTTAASVWVKKIMESARIYGDAATALVLSFGVGLAVVIIGYVKGFNVDLFSYLFGSILAISESDLLVIAAITIATIAFIAIFYRRLVFMTFNEDLAKTSGVDTDFITTVFALLVGMTVVIAIKAVGILLISALLVIPVISALQVAGSFRSTMALSCAISIFAVMAGTLLSFYANLPAGGTIVMVLCAVFSASVLFGRHLRGAAIFASKTG